MRVVVALGNFDGVHLGHAEVVRRAVEEGRRRGMRVLAATFWPHPRAVLRPGEEPPLLTTLEERRRLLMGLGVDGVEVIPFDGKLAKRSPEAFVDETLVAGLGAGVVVVGENFRFGHKAAGHVEDLRRLMRERGGDAVAVPVRNVDGAEGISSTRIRALIAAGEVEEASRLLGRPYSLVGEIVEGDRRGATIGFPTANLLPEEGLVVPARGVYAGFASWRGGERVACTNVGVAPTFGHRESRVEAHLLDFEGDLYGEELRVSFVRRIRGEKRFSGVEDLVAQIRRDVERARDLAKGTF